MEILLTELEINQSLVAFWHEASAAEQKKLKKKLKTIVEQMLREQAKAKMFAVLSEIHDETERNGLTEEVLDELLAEHA